MSIESGTAALQDRLDELWADYLIQLDRYQAAQSDIIKNFSNGFMSLAQANYKSTGGRRYGRDYYDDRMKASRRCRVEDSAGQTLVALEKVEEKASVDYEDEQNASDSAEKPAQTAQQEPTPPATPVPDEVTKEDKVSSEADQTEQELDDESSKEAVAKKPNLDPLHWYGILVPRELRSTQSSFSTVIHDQVGPAVTSAKSMREIEFEIRKLRKALKKAEKESAL